MANTELNIWLRLKDNATRGMQSFKQNWLAITAKIAVATIAIRKAFNLLQLGAQAEEIEDSFKRIANAVNINAAAMKQALNEASGATANFSNVAGNVSALMGQGLNFDQITGLMRVARAEARKMGQDVEGAFIQIANAVAGGFLVTVKRAYGLNVELSSAMKAYAEQTGKTEAEVSKLYKAQALANEIITKAKTDLDAFNMSIRTHLEQIQVLKSRWNEFQEDVGIVLWKVLGALMAGLDVLRSMWAKAFEYILAGIKAIVWYFSKLLEGLESLLTKIPKIGDKFRGLSNSLRETYQDIDNLREGFRVTSEEMAQSAFDSFRAIVQSNDTWATASLLNNKSIGDNTKNTFNAMTELGKRAAQNIQDAFSNFFFKAFTGELNNLREIFAEFGRAVLQTISQVLAMFAVRSMFNAVGWGGLFSNQLGTPYVPQTGVYMLHKGEAVVPANENRGGSGVNINVTQVIQAWDARDVWRNRQMLVTAIAADIESNGTIRNAIRGCAK